MPARWPTTSGERFSEVHPLPGVDLMPVVDGTAEPDADRAVYLMTRDNMLEGDTGASGVARRLGRAVNPPMPLRIQVPAHVAANFEAIVTRVGEHTWKLVRSFDDPATWTEPDVRHLAAEGPAGSSHRAEPLPDQWELYDLDADPVEADNRATDPAAADVLAELQTRLKEVQAESVPERNHPWPYVARGDGGRSTPASPPRRPACCDAPSSGSACTPTTPRPSASSSPAGGRSSSPRTTACSTSASPPGSSPPS